MVIIKNNDGSILPANFTGKTYDLVSKTFINNNKWHRYYGPANIYIDYKQWWFNDKCYGRFDYGYSQKKFLKDVGKLWLCQINT